MRSLLLSLLVAMLAGSVMPAGEEPVKENKLFTFPNDPYLSVDRENHEVRVKADVSPSMRTIYSLLEFLLVSGRYDKDEKTWIYDRGYESLFVTKADPTHFQMGLMLAGLKPGPMPEKPPERMSKDNSERIKGARVEDKKAAASAQMIDVLVEWEKDGKVKTERAEAFLYDRERKKASVTTPFAFTGSYLVSNEDGKKVLASDMTRIMISTFYDESSVLNLPFYTQNPYQGDDIGLELNANFLPTDFQKSKVIIEGHTKRPIKVPVIRPVTLIFRASTLLPPVKKKPEPEKKPEEKGKESD